MKRLWMIALLPFSALLSGGSCSEAEDRQSESPAAAEIPMVEMNDDILNGEELPPSSEAEGEDF